MDVPCTKCSEPYDWHHMRYDEIHETNLSRHVKENWDGNLTKEIRKAFEDKGWKFGPNVFVIYQCPCCKNQKDSAESQGRAEMVSALADVLGDDTDGLISELDDLADMF